MTPELKAAWLAKLKTNPPRATHKFKDSNGACCAIGWLLEVANLDGRWEYQNYIFQKNYCCAKLTPELLSEFGLSEAQERAIEARSDESGWPAVISYIEENL